MLLWDGNNKMTTFERISSRITYKAKKWEFIHKKDYDESGARYPLKEGKSYIICYDTDKREMYLDSKNNVLIGLKNHTLFSKYAKTGIDLRREVYLKPYKLVLTEKIKKRGVVIRYFAQYKLSEFYDKVFEISKQNFAVKPPLYDIVSISWQLKGTKEEVLKKNIESLEKAEEKMWGIRDYLNPLEFYEEEISPEEVLQKRLSKLKFIPGDSEEPFEPGKYNRQRGSKRGRTKQTRSGYHERTQEYTNRGETSGY